MKEKITVLVKCVKDREYMYSPASAHYVATRKAAALIADALNKIAYDLDTLHVWRPMECDKYDTAYSYAEYQRFTLNRDTGAIRERKPARGW